MTQYQNQSYQILLRPVVVLVTPSQNLKNRIVTFLEEKCG